MTTFFVAPKVRDFSSGEAGYDADRDRRSELGLSEAGVIDKRT